MVDILCQFEVRSLTKPLKILTLYTCSAPAKGGHTRPGVDSPGGYQGGKEACSAVFCRLEMLPLYLAVLLGCQLIMD